MIRGVHTMFYTSQPERLRQFIRDTLRFPFTDVGDGCYGLVIHFKMPGGVEAQLYEPRYVKAARPR